MNNNIKNIANVLNISIDSILRDNVKANIDAATKELLRLN